MKARRVRRGARRGGERRAEVVLTVQGQGAGRCGARRTSSRTSSLAFPVPNGQWMLDTRLSRVSHISDRPPKVTPPAFFLLEDTTTRVAAPRQQQKTPRARHTRARPRDREIP